MGLGGGLFEFDEDGLSGRHADVATAVLLSVEPSHVACLQRHIDVLVAVLEPAHE